MSNADRVDGTHSTSILIVAPVPHGGLAALLYGMVIEVREAMAAVFGRRGDHPRPLGV